MSSSPAETKKSLLDLSHGLGLEGRALTILGEGNTSARLGDETFLIKAAGSSLGTLQENDLVECRFSPLLAMLDREELTDQQIEDELLACRVDATAKKPSVEALVHAILLSLPGIGYVGHTHPASVNAILCSPAARDFADSRLFPDQIACCGPASVLIPYTDTGLRLSRAIRHGVTDFMVRYQGPPRVILLESHGVITLGASPNAVLAAMLMADKAAHVFMGAASLGGPILLGAAEVDRIANRLDEHYRQRALDL